MESSEKEPVRVSFADEMKTVLKILSLTTLPHWSHEFLKKRKQKLNRWVHSRSGNKKEDGYDIGTLRKHLENSFLDPNRDIFIHSSFSRISANCKADEIIKLFIEFMNHGTTILMPAYPSPSTMIDWMKDPSPFDAVNASSKMGILSEVFRKTQGTLRSLHPTHSVCAWGTNAKEYTENHHNCVAPCAVGSPFAMLVERNAQIVCLGSDVGKVTAYHLIEDLDSDFPITTNLSEVFVKTVMVGENRIEVATRVLNPALTPWRIDNFEPKLNEFKHHLMSYDCLKTSRLGDANMDIIDVPKFLDMLRDLAKKGVTIYHRPSNPIFRKICGFPY